jgi:hypothetical protein
LLGWVLKVVHPPGHGASRGGNVREITERCTTPISTQAASGCGYQVSGWGLDGGDYLAQFLVACFLDERLGRGDKFLQLVKRLESIPRIDGSEGFQDFLKFGLHDSQLNRDKSSVDGCNGSSGLGPCLQGDLVAVALDPLPYRELLRLTVPCIMCDSLLAILKI